MPLNRVSSQFHLSCQNLSKLSGPSVWAYTGTFNCLLSWRRYLCPCKGIAMDSCYGVLVCKSHPVALLTVAILELQYLCCHSCFLCFLSLIWPHHMLCLHSPLHPKVTAASAWPRKCPSWKGEYPSCTRQKMKNWLDSLNSTPLSPVWMLPLPRLQTTGPKPLTSSTPSQKEPWTAVRKGWHSGKLLWPTSFTSWCWDP